MAGPYNSNNNYNAYTPPAFPPQSPYEPHHNQTPYDDPPYSDDSSPPPPPPPPAHRSPVAVGLHPSSSSPYHDRDRDTHSRSQMADQRPPPPIPYGSQNYSDFSPPTSQAYVAPGAGNLSSAAAGGGVPGIAAGVAATHERDSGAAALRDIESWGRNGNGNGNGGGGGMPARPRGSPSTASASTAESTPFADQYRYDTPPRSGTGQARQNANANANLNVQIPFAAAAIAPSSHSSSSRSLPLSPSDHRRSGPPPEAIALYQDSPYNRYSSSNLNLAPQQLGAIDPREVDDEDDWGMGAAAEQRSSTQQKRRSFVPFGGGGSREGSREAVGGPSAATAAAGGAGGVAAGAMAAGAGAYAARDASGNYTSVPPASASTSHLPLPAHNKEWGSVPKSNGRKKKTWIVGIIIVLVCIGAIVGGILGTQLNKGGKAKSAASGVTQQDVEADNKSELDINSSEIKELMAMDGLHKVFPGVDYTPLNAQYPECIHVPPSQNNITRDIAVLSRMTNAVRLYGTDCNQTEMVLEAITRLDLEKSMKVWLGVWLGDNSTTNTRQVEHMHKLIDAFDADRFKGIIIGNEVLYREELTEMELMKVVNETRSHLKEKGSTLPVATSDLGDNWTEHMAEQVDAVMSNVHPFFAGVTAEEAAGWTWTFWQTHNVILTANRPEIQQIVAEVGWPSAGGNNCGGTTCSSETQGSVASIENLNTFMEDWVCPSLRNGTEYFWFEAFDEPWKIRFNQPDEGQEWEDKWGLMDINRKLKPGVKIPDCGELNLK